MLKPINSIIKDSIRNIVFWGNVVTGTVATDNGDGSYDVFISESDRAYPKIFTLSANPDLAVGDKVRILYMNGCKELPIILPPVTIAITGEWVSPTEHIVSAWWNEERIYDEDISTYSATNVSGKAWSAFVRLTREATLCNKIRLYITYYLGRVDIIDIDAYYDDAWHDVYEGDYTHECDETGNPLEWYEKEIPEGIKTITEFRIRVYNSGATNYGVGLYEVDFFKVDE